MAWRAGQENGEGPGASHAASCGTDMPTFQRDRPGDQKRGQVHLTRRGRFAHTLSLLYRHGLFSPAVVDDVIVGSSLP